MSIIDGCISMAACTKAIEVRSSHKSKLPDENNMSSFLYNQAKVRCILVERSKI